MPSLPAGPCLGFRTSASLLIPFLFEVFLLLYPNTLQFPMKIIAFNIVNAHPWKYSRPGWKAEPDLVDGNPFQSRGAGTRF